jgi:hypothetical protein
MSRNPETKRIAVRMKLSKQGLQDRCGIAWTGDHDMGTLVVTGVEEIQKHTGCRLYSSTKAIKERYKPKSNRMKHASLLSK